MHGGIPGGDERAGEERAGGDVDGSAGPVPLHLPTSAPVPFQWRKSPNVPNRTLWEITAHHGKKIFTFRSIQRLSTM